MNNAGAPFVHINYEPLKTRKNQNELLLQEDALLFLLRCKHLFTLSNFTSAACLFATSEGRLSRSYIGFFRTDIPSSQYNYNLLIAHQDDVEHFLASFFMEQKPEVIGNDYLVIGTLDRAVWKRGTQQPLNLQETLEALHDFKEVITFKVTGGWMRDEAKPSTKKRRSGV
jgi:hypothetical protein